MNIIKKTLSIIPTNQRNKIFLILILILIQIFIEMLGLGIIIPVVTAILDIDFFYEKFHFLNLESYNLDDNELIFYSLIFLLVVFYLKNLYLIFFSWFRNRFSNGIWVNVCSKLINAYLNKSYLYHVDVNTSEVIRNIEDAQHFEGFLNNLIFITAEILLIIFILTSLIILDPFLTISTITIIFAFGFIFFSLTRKKLKNWGLKRADFRKLSTKYLIEAIIGIKESTVNNVVDFFKNKYIKTNKYHSYLHFRYNFVDSLPRILIEIVAITALVVFMLILVNSNTTPQNIIIFISFLSACTIRLMPSISKILAGINFFTYIRPVVINLYDVLNQQVELKENIKSEKNLLNKFDNSIEIKNLYFKFPETENIFENLNLSLKKGKFIGIIGESGSGKSTLINLILGLIKPQEGKLLCDGIDIHDNIKNWRNLIGYVSQDTYILDDSLRNNIAFGVEESFIDDNLVKEAINKSQLTNFFSKLNNGLDHNLGENASKISGGQKQRIGIARALYRKARILIFDEATSNLDKKTSDEFLEYINSIKRNFTIIFITHKPEHHKYCDEVYKIFEKNISLEKNK